VVTRWDDGTLAISHAAVQCEPRSVADLLDFGEHVLQGSRHIDSSHAHRDDAETLLDAVLRGASRSAGDRPTKSARDRYLAMIARRAGGEPIAQITGAVDFDGLSLRVRRGTFVPRPSSVWTVEYLADACAQSARPTVVDLCTGVGAIGLGLARRLPDAEVWGTDISEVACHQARDNARRLGLTNVRIRRGSAFDPLPRRLTGEVDAVVGYIPYLSSDDIRGLYTEVGTYDALHTLTDLSEDGFDLLRHVVQTAPQWLRPGGRLVIQIDPDTAPRLGTLFTTNGLQDVQVIRSERSWDVLVEGVRPT
jgi:release factor glutamine methyltransferase